MYVMYSAKEEKRKSKMQKKECKHGARGPRNMTHETCASNQQGQTPRQALRYRRFPPSISSSI